MTYSSIGKRLIAFIVDSILVSAIGTILMFTAEEWYYGSISLLIGAAYFILCEGGSWHATVGKKIVGIKVVDERGAGLDYGQAAVRYLGRILSWFIFGIGYLMALFDNRNQALHDRLARSYVVDNLFAGAGVGSGDASGRSVVGVTGEVAGMRFPIIGNGLMIGRDNVSCQIVLRNSKGVSRLHCLVSYNPASNMFILSDRNSKYGTFTEKGVRVTPNKSVALRSGERFYLGNKDTMFEVV